MLRKQPEEAVMVLLALVLTVVLAAVYLLVGVLKLITPRDRLLANPRMGWANDYPARSIKGIGLAEVLGAVGLVAPWYLWVAPVLTPVAALLLAVLQGLAVATHVRRGELAVVPGNVVLIVLALALVALRLYTLAQGPASAY